MSKPDFVVITEPSWASNHPGEIVFMVKINTLSESLTSSNAVVLGIAEGLKAYVKDTAAPQMLEMIKERVMKEIEAEVAKFASQKAVQIAAELDLKGMANIAAIKAAKQLGASFSEEQ